MTGFRVAEHGVEHAAHPAHRVIAGDPEAGTERIGDDDTLGFFDSFNSPMPTISSGGGDSRFGAWNEFRGAALEKKR